MKRGYTEFDRSEICFIFSLSRWTKLVNRNMILLNVSHKRLLSQSMSAVSCIPSIFMTNDLSNSSRVKKGHRVTLPSQLSGRYCMKRKRKRKKKFIEFTNSVKIVTTLHHSRSSFHTAQKPSVLDFAFVYLFLNRLFYFSAHRFCTLELISKLKGRIDVLILTKVLEKLL